MAQPLLSPEPRPSVQPTISHMVLALLVFLFAVSFIGPFIAEALDTVNQTEVTA